MIADQDAQKEFILLKIQQITSKTIGYNVPNNVNSQAINQAYQANQMTAQNQAVQAVNTTVQAINAVNQAAQASTQHKQNKQVRR